MLCPKPVSGTCKAAGDPVLFTLNVADMVPVVLAVKVTVMLQVAAETSEAPQPLVRE